MKTFFTVLLALFLSSFTPTYSFCDELGDIQISLIEGNVQVYDHEADEWTPATINMPLAVGDLISVPQDGRAELHIQGGIFVRLDYSTSMELVSISDKDAHLYLNYGQIYINNKKGGREIIQIDTPTATCTTADNSISLLEVVDNETTELSLVKGYAFLESNQGKTRVTAGNSLKVGNNGAELSPIAVPDEWERWNYQRDATMQKLGQSARFLPEELHDYSNDFDSNGTWTFIKEYGYVWTPTVITPEWVPFRLGQWIWIHNDYVWVPEERWGWAPHHFGRWTNIKGAGWCWVPPRTGAVTWGPGAVAWVQTSSTIAWVPLAPGEVYYGRRSYGQGSALMPNKNNAHQAPAYRNIHINNAVTTISINSFQKRDKQRNVIRNENPFNNRNYSIPVIPPPAKKVRIDNPSRPTAPPVTAEKPTMHHMQQKPVMAPRNNETPHNNQIKTSEPVKPSVSYGRTDNQTPIAKPAVIKEVPKTSTTAPQLYQPNKPSTQQTVNRPIQNKTDQNMDRAPRPFVRDSGQSAFRKDHPQQLVPKKLDEPKKESTRQQERSKTDDSSKTNVNSQTKTFPKVRSDKP